MPSSGVSKMMNVAVLAVRSWPEQLVVHHDFGDAAIGQAADKAGAADVD